MVDVEGPFSAQVLAALKEGYTRVRQGDDNPSCYSDADREACLRCPQASFVDR